MSLPPKLGDNQNAILRALFEQRLDTLRNNIISFIGNALKDETVNILNESDTTRAFVVDRILEVVSENLESEKETTIYKLIQNVNDRQKVIDDNADELQKLKESVFEKESTIKSKTDKIKCIENELKIKVDQIEKQQIQTDQQQEQIQNLHEKLENALKKLQDQQTKLDEQCTENKQLKDLDGRHDDELVNCYKQIEVLRISLMKSESERLVLRKQYMDIGQKLEFITSSQNNQGKQFEQKQKELREVVMENESLKEELEKIKASSDDVATLRKQLESERNISKMYIDELQKLKMDLHQKDIELNHKSMKIQTNQQYINTQKNKIHEYYQNMIDSNMIKLRDEYEAHITEITQQYNEALANIQNQEQEKLVEEQSKLLLKMKEKEEKLNEEEVKKWQSKLDEYKSEQLALQEKVEKYQIENEKLRNDVTNKEDEITKNNKSMEDSRKVNDDLTIIINKLRTKMDIIQETKDEDTSNIEQLRQEMKQLQDKNESIRSKLDKSKSNYQQKLQSIGKVCRNIKFEIRNNKDEVEFIKSSIQIYMARTFHEIQMSFNKIQSMSEQSILLSKSGMKDELSKSLLKLKKYQDSKLQSIEHKMKSMIHNNESLKDLDLKLLEDEVDTIKDQLAQARDVLSTKPIKFRKISVPSSMDSSAISIKKKKEKKKNSKRESYDTATIRKLRNDLQSLEDDYRFNKKYIKNKYSKKNGKGVDDTSSANLL